MRANRYIYLIEYLQNNFCENILEIGVSKGDGAEEMILNSKNPDVNYFGIDLFEDITDEIAKKEVSILPTDASMLPNSLEIVLARLQKISEKIFLFKGFSSNIYKENSWPQFDLIFIDGGHSFETVKSDFENYVNLLKPSGIIFLDDYNTEFTGIKHFVDDYLINDKIYEIEIYHDLKDNYRGHDYKLVSVRKNLRCIDTSGVRLESSPFHNRRIDWSLYQPLVGSTMLELGNKKNDLLVYKHFFESLGFKHTSIDLNGLDGSLSMDLQQPLNLGTFDMVTNMGTSEHVENQEKIWRNIAEAIANQGILISSTPLPGDWKFHGKHYPTIQFYEEFAKLNYLKIERLFIYEESAYGIPDHKLIAFRAKRIKESQFTMPDLKLIFINGDFGLGVLHK